MNNKVLFLGGIGLLIIVAGIFSMNQQPSQPAAETTVQGGTETGEAVSVEDQATGIEESAVETDPSITPGSYTEYSAQSLETATATGKAVLFFHASWCPTCKAANEAFTTRASEIPAGVTILKADYDAEKDLKARYGITYQHTFVQIDAEGNEITKWNGGDIEELQENLK
jgi:thiol-disulfide isomerase/thioredoxin